MTTELDDSNFTPEENKRCKVLQAAENKKKQEQSRERQNSDQQSEWDACFEAANKKIEALNSKCKKSIKEVVLALASELKGLRFPVDRIANEIVHQSKGKWGS